MEAKKSKMRWILSLVLSVLHLSLAVTMLATGDTLLGTMNLVTAALWIVVAIIRTIERKAVWMSNNETDAQ